MALVEAYDQMNMNLSLSKPFLRKELESNLKMILTNTKSKHQVTRETIQLYKDAFLKAQEQSQLLVLSCTKYFGSDALLEPPLPLPPTNGVPPTNTTTNYAPQIPFHSQENNHPINQINQGNPNCDCGIPSIHRQVKKEGPSFGKIFYSCSKSLTEPTKCNFFQWQDTPDVRSSDRHSPPNNTLLCECGLASVERTVKKQGVNYGKEFYVCSKNQEDSTRCNMFQVCLGIILICFIKNSGKMVFFLILFILLILLIHIIHIIHILQTHTTLQTPL